MPKATPDKEPVHILLEKDLMKRIDDFRFKHRFQTRAAVIRWLLDAALRVKLTPKMESET